MRMSIVSALFRKEILEVLRDKKMLYLVILMPFFLYPVLFIVMGKVGASAGEKLATKEVTVFMDPALENSAVSQMLAADSTLELEFKSLPTEERDSLRGNQLVIEAPADYETRLDSMEAVAFTIYGDNSEDVVSRRRQRVQGMLSAYNEQIVSARLAAADLPSDFNQAVQVTNISTASERAAAGAGLGRVIPMMLLLFIFTGCIYIAIDATAGEKERRTLQTLYTSPATTKEIIAGKFGAVATVGIVSALANLGSLVLSMQLSAYVLGDEGPSIGLSLGGFDFVVLTLLVILATIFMAAISMAVVLLANTYKEAQSYVSPLMFMILIPAGLAAMPGAELTLQTAFVPIYNVALGMADIFKGDYDLSLIGIVVGTSLLFGLIALWLAGRTFGNENVVTGQSVNVKDLLKG
ncbi:MAG: ABC transporter permease [Bacteroidota bacterium]